MFYEVLSPTLSKLRWSHWNKVIGFCCDKVYNTFSSSCLLVLIFIFLESSYPVLKHQINGWVESKKYWIRDWSLDIKHHVLLTIVALIVGSFHGKVIWIIVCGAKFADEIFWFGMQAPTIGKKRNIVIPFRFELLRIDFWVLFFFFGVGFVAGEISWAE